MGNVETSILSYREINFVTNHSDSKITETDIIKMLDFLINNNIFVTFERRVFQQTIGIPMEANEPLFLPTCSFIIMRLTSNRNFLERKKKLAISFNFSFRYINDVL